MTARPLDTRMKVKSIARRTADLVAGAIADEDVTLLEDYAYPEFGIPSQETLDTIRLGARLEGMIADPVYAGPH